MRNHLESLEGILPRLEAGEAFFGHLADRPGLALGLARGGSANLAVGGSVSSGLQGG